MNPWGLTPRQCDLMDALCRSGLLKVAAYDCGISVNTAKGHLRYIRVSMRERTLVRMCLSWAEWRKANRPALKVAA